MLVLNKRGKSLKIPSIIEASKTIDVDREITLLGDVDFQAASSDGVKADTLYLIANTGKPMQVKGYPHPVIVNMAGHVFAKERTPVIGDHDTSNRFGHSTDQITVVAGETKSLKGKPIQGPAIAAAAVRSSQSEFAKDLEADLKSKFPFQVSVGTKIIEGYFVEEGETDTVNGQVWEGPLIVADKSMTRELTVTVLGADGDTSASIVAKAKQGDNEMNFTEWLKATFDLLEEGLSASSLAAFQKQFKTFQASEKELTREKGKKSKTVNRKKNALILAGQGPDDDEDEDEDDTDDDTTRHRNLMASESERIDMINATARRFEGLEKIKVGKKELTMSQFKAKAIRDGLNANEFELECRRSELPEPTGMPNFAIHAKSGAYDSRAVEIAILRAAGVLEKAHNNVSGRDYGIQAMYDQKALEAADAPMYRSFSGSFDELCDITIRAAGSYPQARHGTDLVAQAHDVWSKLKGRPNIEASGFSTLILTNILENVANKAAVASFDAGEASTWRQITGRRPLNDFKAHSLYTLDLDGSFKKVAADGELKHITMRDTKRSIQADTYGAMITIDRKTRINDDLGLVVQKAASMGSLAVFRIEESVYVLLLSNPGSFFSSGNGNLISGAGSVLGVDSLQTAAQRYQDQTLYGKPIQVSPSILLTGSTLSIYADQLMTNKTFYPGGSNTDTRFFTTNPVAGLYKRVSTGYLNNTNIKDQDGNSLSGQSATQWYLLGNPNSPQGATIVIGFLNGRETPFFDQADTQFNIPGGIQMRSYLDWGVALHLTQMGVKSTGA